VTAPRWVRWWFRGAAVYGVLGLMSLVLTQTPPNGDALYFYGFVGTAMAFQFVFWIIGGDPIRFRTVMLACPVEKLGFVIPITVLAVHDGVGSSTIAAGVIDLVLGIGFVAAYRATPRK
jgi:hypothetical protein